jgi:hypothetical protein
MVCTVAAFASAPATASGTPPGRSGPLTGSSILRGLVAVAATSAKNAWAVGWSLPPAPTEYPPTYTLIERSQSVAHQVRLGTKDTELPG